MSRLIDADKLKQHYAWWENGTAEMTLDEAKRNFDAIIGVQPTVDAVPTEFHDKCMEIEIQKRMDLELNSVEVVRCKDCEYYSHEIIWDGEFTFMCELTLSGANDEGFCAWGERKKDAKEE